MMKPVKKNQKFFFIKMRENYMAKFLIYFSKKIRVNYALIAKEKIKTLQ